MEEVQARSWLKLGPFSLQTSEFAKLSTVILLGQYLVLKEREIRSITVLIIPFIIVIIPMVFIIVQPDFGTAVSFIPILLAMLFLGGADIMHISSLDNTARRNFSKHTNVFGIHKADPDGSSC
jgi:rod shape determining protein RodA